VKDPWGGSEELWAHAAKEALAEGHQVCISAYDRGRLSPGFRSLQAVGAKVYVRRGYIKPGTGLYKRVFRKALNFALNKVFNPFAPLFHQKPDIVIYSGSCYSIVDDPGLIRLLKKHTIPFLINNQVNIEYGKPINAEGAAIIRDVYAMADKVLFVSQRNLEVARRHLLAPIENSQIIRNPVNLVNTDYVEFPVLKGQVRFAMVANLLVNHKGHDLLFDVLRKSKWVERSWILHVYGSGDDEQYIRDLSRFFGLEDRIILQGSTDDIRKVWMENHVLIMPSLCEGIPLAVVEAMLCGRPVVATDTGGHMEWITDDKNGYIAEGANVYALDKALERAWQNRENWKHMGEKAREAALERYDPKAGKTLLNIILAHGSRS
jgi:glycosyltransferase involved in cell wall biosynthesis